MPQRNHSATAHANKEEQQVFTDTCVQKKTDMRTGADEPAMLRFRPHGGMASAFAFGEWASNEVLRIARQRFWS